IERSRKFYAEVFGMEVTGDRELSEELMMKLFGAGSRARLVKLKIGDIIVELFKFIDMKDQKTDIPYNIGISHFALFVGDRKEFIEKLKKLGMETIVADRGDGNLVYFTKDPDGVLIELRD
ncbi:VOC family protein, partial [Candidatus Margulisiibacteriota bacterium]